MTIDADYHNAQILILYTQLEEIQTKVDHSAMGRSFDYGGAVDRILAMIEWHRSQINQLDGPFELETQGIP